MSSSSRNEIVRQILALANDKSGTDGASKTDIMYKVFLSHDQLNEYLMILTESDLLCYYSERQTYKTTEKGRMFLQAYNKIDQMLKEKQI